MESTDSSINSQHQSTVLAQHPLLPPGFRFHPTDEELVVHYLKRKAASVPLPVTIIAEVDIYKFDPWELPAKASFGEQEWYFFSPRDRKYPNGARPNRAATSGYWKATGTDKPILSSSGTQKVGVKKALVFYGGKPPKGIKTNWIMHEYRLAESSASTSRPPGVCSGEPKKNSLRLDDWVLCRIYKKNSQRSVLDSEDSMDEMLSSPLGRSSSLLALGAQQNSRTNFATTGTNSGTYSALLANEHNFLDGLLSQDTMIGVPVKRAVNPIYLIDYNTISAAAGKRFRNEAESSGANSNNHQNRGVTASAPNGDNNIAALLNHMPQAPYQQQNFLGALDESTAVLRSPPSFQISGLNWSA